eukprot:321507-Chlamydomonas_euryale.AAC.2
MPEFCRFGARFPDPYQIHAALVTVALLLCYGAFFRLKSQCSGPRDDADVRMWLRSHGQPLHTHLPFHTPTLQVPAPSAPHPQPIFHTPTLQCLRPPRLTYTHFPHPNSPGPALLRGGGVPHDGAARRPPRQAP